MSPPHPSPSAAAPLLPAGAVEGLFDEMPDVVYFLKDARQRYVSVNQTLVERCGFKSKEELLGRTVREIFPRELAESYERQDREVLRSGRSIRNRLELHWQKHRRTGWCLTSKQAIRDEAGGITGLIGISRDLATPGSGGKVTIPPSLARMSDYLEQHIEESTLSPATLAAQAGLSSTRFARLVKRIYQLTPGQLITQARIQAASRLLGESRQSVADVALACGFCDHSAFTRAFRTATGVTPTQFRAALE